jgi:triosephosphate isomerase
MVANWKMNGDPDFADRFVAEINAANTENIVVACPPVGLIHRFRDFRHYVGAQNCFHEKNGAFTGENSPQLLKGIGCSHVIVGHSERRNIFHETDDVIRAKWAAAVDAGLIPIVCIGERIDDRDVWKEILADQLRLFLGDGPMAETIFAYEPVWSIGAGLTPEPEEIEEILGFLRDLLGNPDRCTLLYGGSVGLKNAAEILTCRHLDGLLIGGASLRLEEFKEIIQL